MIEDEVIIYTDGACSGNPGPGGWGAIIIYNQKVQELGYFSEQPTTNNRMEILSIIESLKWIQRFKIKSNLCICTDSQYVINAMTKWIFGWIRNDWKTAAGEEVKNQDLFKELNQILKLVTYRFQYVPGHAGYWGNERADQIAVAFSKQQSVDLYSGSWSNYEYSTQPMMANISSNLVSKASNKASPAVKVGYVVWDYQTLSFFTEWTACAKVTQGRAGVKFKKIKNLNELKAFVELYGCPASEIQKIEKVFKL